MLNQPDLLRSLLGFMVKPAPSTALFVSLFFLNMGIGASMSYILLNYFKLAVVKRKKEFLYLLAAIGTFIPILGIIVGGLVIFLIKKYAKDFQPIEIDTYQPVEYIRKKATHTVAYGSSWATTRLYSKQYSPQERQQALQSISKGFPRETNLIYSQLVSDDLEELRLLAFSMLEKQQDYLQVQISLLLEKFEEAIEFKQKAYLAKQLALLYWELVYRHLSAQEFRTIALERSTFFADLAIQVFDTDSSLYILLAKLNIEKGHLEAGLRYLKLASQFQTSNSRTMPYLAEHAYKNKNYQAVKQYLCADPSLRYAFRINKIVEFWCNHEHIS